MGDVGQAIQRAEDKTAQMQARAGAIDELLASGALDTPGDLGRGDDISRELEAMSSESDVERELAALKAGSTPEGLPAGSGDEAAESSDEAAPEYTQPGEPPAPEQQTRPAD
jgi:phage shock protein A